MVLVLGDAHADEANNLEALLNAYRQAGESVALQVGDLMYYDLPVPTWFIAGNNEDFDVIDALRTGEQPPRAVENARLLASTVTEIEGLRVGGLSGNYAPTKYQADRVELVDDRRRHFTHEDVERALKLEDIDVFLTHEAPHGLITDHAYAVGCSHIDRILSELTPSLCLVGHHHQYAEARIGECRVVSIPPVSDGYYIMDSDSLTLTWHPQRNESLRSFL